MTSTRTFFLAFVGAFCGTSLSVLAQTDASGFRTDTPVTLTPTPQAPRMSAEQIVLEAFSEKYVAAGRPRALLFWNREVDDEIGVDFETERRSRTGERSNTQSSSEETDGPAGNAQLTDREVVRTGDRESLERTRRVDSGGRTHSLGERNDWALESSYMATLQNAGLRLVDRNVAMRRMQAMGGVSDAQQQQLVEAKALTEAAEWVVEVTLSPDPKAALAWAFRIDVTDTRSGEVLARTFTQGHLPELERHLPLVAGARGFERATPVKTPVTMETVGRQIALETLSALVRRLPAR